jgi:hypothetical protein
MKPLDRSRGFFFGGPAHLLPSATRRPTMSARSLLVLACTAALPALAQQNDVPLERDIYYDIDRNGACRTSTVHTGLRPIIESRADLENVMGFRPDSSRHYYFLTTKLFKEHLIQVKSGDFRVTIDPAFRFEVGKDFVETGVANTNSAQNSYNSRGFWIKADLGRTVSFQTGFYENLSIVPLYLYTYVQGSGVVPGQGRVKGFGERGLDFAWSHGNVSWSPKRWLNVQFGNGRHFVGNGYRSVLLSDNTFPYPYLKFSAITNDQRFQYTTINTKFQMVNDPEDRLGAGESSENLFFWKRGSFKHLSTNLGPLQLGLFEATIWRNIDSAGVRPFNAMELNPVIGLNTLVNGFDGEHMQLLGLDAKYRLTDKLFVYGQVAMDGAKRNAWQAGVQWFDLLRRDLHVLLEYNSVAPFTYTSSRARGSYSHYNQPLAHTLGTGVDEALVIVDYGIKQKFWIKAQASMSISQLDTSATRVSGSNIFDTRDATGADSLSVQRQRNWLDLSFAWRFNQMSNASFSVGYIVRDVSFAPDILNSHYLYITLRTGLFNRYFDL